MKLKTDLLNPKNFNRSQSELEEFLLLCIFVAGKSSKTQYHKLELFLDELDVTNGIFKALSLLSIEEIKEKLIKVKSGQYSRLCGCLFKQPVWPGPLYSLSLSTPPAEQEEEERETGFAASLLV